MTDFVHFKFDHEGSWHRIALPTRGRKLFPRLKKRINYVLGVTQQELYWDDGETINVLNDSVDLHAAIAFAMHQGHLCAIVPCVYVQFTPVRRLEEPVDAQGHFLYYKADRDRSTAEEDSSANKTHSGARRIHVSVDEHGRSQWRAEDPYRPTTDQAFVETTADPSACAYGNPSRSVEALAGPTTWEQPSDAYAGPDEALLSLLPALAQCSRPLNVSLNETTDLSTAVIECHCEDRSTCGLSSSQCKVTCPDRDRHIREALLCEAVKNFQLEQQAAAQREGRNEMGEPQHIPTEAETLEYGPAIFALHNEIAASKERIAQTIDRFEKKREAQNLIQHKMQLYKERKHLLETNHDLREEVRLAADYFRAFTADDGDEVSEMQRARNMEIVKDGISGKIPFEDFQLAGVHQRKIVQNALPFLRVAIDAGIEKIDGLPSRIADRVASKASKRNSGDHTSDSSGSWESALEELHKPNARPLNLGTTADVSSCCSALSNMDQPDNKRSDISNTELQPTKSTRTATIEYHDSALPNAEQVVMKADLTSAVTMDHESVRPVDMDERKRAILQGTYVPPPTIRRSDFAISQKYRLTFEAGQRALGVRSSEYPDAHQIAEQRESDRLADQFAALPDVGVNVAIVRLQENEDEGVHDVEEVSISTTPPPLVEQVVTSMLDAKRSSIATVLNKQFGGDREGLAVHSLIGQSEPLLVPSAPNVNLMDANDATEASTDGVGASLHTLVMPSPPKLMAVADDIPATIDRHQERVAELERKKAKLREMRLAKERAYSHKDEQNRGHHAILEGSLAYTAYPDGVYDVLSHRPLPVPTTESNTINDAKYEEPAGAQAIGINAAEVVSPTKEPVETSLQRFKIDYRANELQRRKAKAAEMRRARRKEQEVKQQTKEREIWMRAEQSRLAGEGFLADLRNLLVGLNSVTAEAATEEFLYTARSFISSPKLNAVVALIFDMAVERAECAELYARLCAAQVIQETATSGDAEGPFYQAVFSRAHDIFHMRRRMMNLQQDDTQPLRAKMYGHIMFAGHLFMHDVLPPGFILLAAVQLLQSVIGELNEQTQVDNDSISCAVRLLLLCGDRLDAVADDEQRASSFSMPVLMATLEAAVPYVDERVRAMIVEMANMNAGWAQQQLPAGGGQVAGAAVAGNGESMLDVVSDLLYANTASNMDNTARQLFALAVHEPPLLKEVVALIFDKATDQPSMHEYDAGLCAALIAMEVSQGTISKYRFTIIDFIKETMQPTTEVERRIEMGETELAEELDGNMQGHLQMELINLRAQVNRKKLAKFTFFAEICLLDQHAQMQDTLESAILHLLRTLLDSQFLDDEAVECAVVMLDRTGKMLAEAERDHTEMDRVYRALQSLPHDSGMRLENKVGRLLSTRANGWVHEETASFDAGLRDINPKQLRAENREKKEDADRQHKLSLDLEQVMNEVDSDHIERCIDHFLHLRVDAYAQSSLKRVVTVIFDFAIDRPARADLYASICAAQIQFERTGKSITRHFQDFLIEHAKWLLRTEWREENVAEREMEILTEIDEDKRLNMQIELIEITCTARKRKFAAIDFVGRLFMIELIPARIINETLKELLKTMDSRDEAVDEESVRCALQLLQQCGKQLYAETRNGKHPPCFNFYRHFDTLSVGMGRVSEEIRDQIKYLNDLRANNWSELAVERNIVDGLMAQEAALVMNNVAEEEEEEDEAFQDDADWLYDSASDGDEDEDLNQEEAQEELAAEQEQEEAEEEAALLAARQAAIIAEEQAAEETKNDTKPTESAPQPSSDDEKGRSSTSSWSKVDSTDSDV